MKVILFGATGMIGQAVLRECLQDPDVDGACCRSAGGRRARSTPSCARSCTTTWSTSAPIEAQLAGYDACFFCLGSTSVGMTEAEYTRVTYDVAHGGGARRWPARARA